MRFALHNPGKPYRIPFTHRNTPTKNRWTYSEHGRLAWALIVMQDSPIPSYTDLPDTEEEVLNMLEDTEEQDILAESMRQATLLAIEREPTKLFADPEKLKAKLEAERGNFGEDVEKAVRKALGYADDLVEQYFKPGDDPDVSRGAQMIEEQVQKKKEGLCKAVHQRQLRQ